ncbi:MAG: FAD-dependent oxidoreductase [Bacillus subtilis]|nr:FAD-dependent oxidoreductase [Bacillus subtilis]
MVEKLPIILAQIDDEVRDSYLKILKRQNDQCRHQAPKSSGSIKARSRTVKTTTSTKRIQGETVLVAVGMRPNTKGLENLKLVLENGGVKTNERFGNFGERRVRHRRRQREVDARPYRFRRSDRRHRTHRRQSIEHIDYGKIPSAIYGFPEIVTLGSHRKTSPRARPRHHRQPLPDWRERQVPRRRRNRRVRQIDRRREIQRDPRRPHPRRASNRSRRRTDPRDEFGSHRRRNRRVGPSPSLDVRNRSRSRPRPRRQTDSSLIKTKGVPRRNAFFNLVKNPSQERFDIDDAQLPKPFTQCIDVHFLAFQTHPFRPVRIDGIDSAVLDFQRRRPLSARFEDAFGKRRRFAIIPFERRVLLEAASAAIAAISNASTRRVSSVTFNPASTAKNKSSQKSKTSPCFGHTGRICPTEARFDTTGRPRRFRNFAMEIVA